MIQSEKQKRLGSVYIAVTGTAMLVSIISLTAMHLARLELRGATALENRTYARSLAQSGVEFALAKIDLDSDWRTTYTHNVENTATPIGFGTTLRFKYLDNNDANLGNDNSQPVEIQGIGRYGGATVVYSATYAPSETTEQQVSPASLRNFEPGSNWSSLTINNLNSIGQYFLPSLPAETISWTVTSIEVQIKHSGAAGSTLDASLYLPDGSLLPGTLLESIAVPETALPSSTNSWYQFAFSGASGLDPTVGLCLTLSTTASPASDLDFESSGVTETNAHMLTKSGSSWSANASQSLYYRVHGVYTTSVASGEFTITPGSWRPTAAN